jgi:heme O synthase-like polyprenyltransferase
MNPKQILPFELKTTHVTQIVIYLWVALLFVLPIFVCERIRTLSYLISILVMMIVFLSFFLATQNSMKKDEDDQH